MAVTDRFGTHRELPGELALPPGRRLPVAVQTVLFMTERTWIGPRWQRHYCDVFAGTSRPPGGPSGS